MNGNFFMYSTEYEVNVSIFPRVDSSEAAFTYDMQLEKPQISSTKTR